MGKIAQAVMTGSIRSVHVDLICENDEWEYEERAEGPHLLHRRPRLGADRGDLEGGYARAILPSGDVIVTLVDRDKLEKMRDCSDSVKAQKRKADKGEYEGTSPYDDWTADMYKAKIVNVAEKFWPKTLGLSILPAAALDPNLTDEERAAAARNVTPAGEEAPALDVPQYIDFEHVEAIKARMEKLGVDEDAICNAFEVENVECIPADMYATVMARLDDFEKRKNAAAEV
jgi:hypothetical protein